MRLRHVWVSTLGLALAVSITACGGSKETPATSATPEAGGAGGGQKVDMATVGSVKGSVTVDGAVPKNEPIKMNADPVCAKENTTPQF